MSEAYDLFAGAGGWDVAAERLGIRSYGVENMKAARETRDAAGLRTIHDDVWTFDTTFPIRVDGLIASPPCQTFSVAGSGSGRRALDDVLTAVKEERFSSLDELRSFGEKVGDDRTALVLTPLAYAHLAFPKWIAWEQVPTVLPVWEACAEVLSSWGYSTWTGNLQAEQYGVPQTRKRAFLLASMDREVGKPVPTHSKYYPRSPTKLDEGVQKWVSMAEALGVHEQFSVISNYGTGGDASARGRRRGNEPAATVTPKIGRNKVVFCGAGATSELTAGQVPRTPDQPAHTITGKGTAYWREPLPEWSYNRPSTTIVGSFKPEIVAAPGYRTTVSRQNAPDSVRVTVQEAGILQSFPADYPWQGAKGKQYLQVGNAVPPLLAEAVLREVTGL